LSPVLIASSQNFIKNPLLQWFFFSLSTPTPWPKWISKCLKKNEFYFSQILNFCFLFLLFEFLAFWGHILPHLRTKSCAFKFMFWSSEIEKSCQKQWSTHCPMGRLWELFTQGWWKNTFQNQKSRSRGCT
jgi:hypothetical protein